MCPSGIEGRRSAHCPVTATSSPGSGATSPNASQAWIGQLIGGVGGASIIYGIASGRDGFERGQFAANLWSGEYYGVGAAIVAEVVLTALLVMVVLFTTTRSMAPGMGGLVAGLTRTVIHLISIPIDNTSVNPARAIGAALFADTSFEALQQLWVFVVFPLVGCGHGLAVPRPTIGWCRHR